jgi:uridine kinase
MFMGNIGQKIVVFGSPGSGKTYFCKKMASRLGIECFHLDDIFWQENWNRLDTEVFRSKVNNILDGECWIIDGNFVRYISIDLRAQRADTVIFIDAPVVLCLYRAIKRALQLLFFSNAENTLPANVVNGYKKGTTKIFSDFWWFLRFIFMFPVRDGRDIRNRLKKYANVIILKDSESDRFLDALSA